MDPILAAVISGAFGTSLGMVIFALLSKFGKKAEAKAALPEELKKQLEDVSLSVQKLVKSVEPIREAIVVLLGAVELLLLQEKDRCDDCPSKRRSSVDSIEAALGEIRATHEIPSAARAAS
jgi:hypothetical protein